MKMNRRNLLTNMVVFYAVILLPAAVWAAETVSVTETKPVPSAITTLKARPVVQIAILLDTSGSMDGLIGQAKTQLWSIVNEFIFARRGGIAPDVQVALYEYGNDGLSSKEGYIRQVVPFSTDLDKISEELFALKTNGGQEYCGQVIHEATKSLKWSSSSDDLKVIFIAGNEPFTQGSVEYKKACKEAIAKGIIVNTIHCGTESEGVRGNWKDGAVLADGTFLNIDQNSQIIHIEAPQDKEIAAMSSKLNETYIAIGSEGQIAQQRQSAQDLNASNMSKEAALQRSVAKSSFNYRNSNWDLVDALKDEKFKLEDVNTADLPENMQKMTTEQRKAYADSKAKDRVEIQQKIQVLNTQRNNYIAVETKKQQGDKTLGSAIINSVRQQAVKKNFEFKPPEEPKPQNPQPQNNTQ
jgi:hypothetical protein